ncbi:PAS fold family protein [Enterobacter roggenkampii]
MSAPDPSIPAQASQPIDLDNVIKFIDGLYCNSPLPVCVRNQFREVIYKNDTFDYLFHPASKDYAGISFDKDEVELELSSIELESFMMGPGTAVCRSFSYKGEYYQLRIEIRVIDNELFALWLINNFPSYRALFHVHEKPISESFNIDFFLSNITTRKMITLCFYVLGFQLATASRYLGVTEKAISNRLSSVKKEISKHFIDHDDFRIYCLKHGIYTKMISVVLKIINVKPVLKK